jgi:hypothetical protein
MNGKFEEQLARLAFGDVSPEEAARIERQAENDPKAAKALAEFRQMRAGLRNLASVPDHQLSNERLRDAILARGLDNAPTKPVPQSEGIGWLWMPVAAAALGFGLFMLRNHRTGEPEIVLNPQSGLGGEVALKSPDLKPAHTDIKSTYVVNATPRHSDPVTNAYRATLAESGSRHATGRHNRRFTNDAKDVTVHWTPWAVPPTDADPQTGTEAIVAENISDNPPPIVLIDGNPDSTTGAPTATEVGTASNVVIGG